MAKKVITYLLLVGYYGYYGNHCVHATPTNPALHVVGLISFMCTSEPRMLTCCHGYVASWTLHVVLECTCMYMYMYVLRNAIK